MKHRRAAMLVAAVWLAGAAVAQTPQQQLEAAERTYERTYDWQAMAALAKQAEADGRPDVAAEAYVGAADLASYWGPQVVRPEVSVPLARKAAEIYHRLGDGEKEAVAMRYVAILVPASERLPVVRQTLGLIKPYRTKLAFDVLLQCGFIVQKGDPKLAAAIYEDEVSLADELGDRVLGLLARSDEFTMATKPPEEVCKEAEQLAREAASIAADGAVNGDNNTLFLEACNSLATEMYTRGDYDPAEQVLALSVEQSAACGKARDGMLGLSFLAAVQVRHNGNRRALENVTQAVDLLMGAGGRVAELGPYQAMHGQWYSAAHYLRADDQILRVYDSSLRLLRAGESTFPGVVVGAALYRKGDLKGAEGIIREVATTTTDPWGFCSEALCRLWLGRVLYAEGSW